MFSIKQIEQAHEKVKSGAEFPAYIQEIKQLGVIAFETWVIDSHTEYFGNDNFKAQSEAQYQNLEIAPITSSEKFKKYLKIHQQGQTDYPTFCQHCAETGIVKWYVDLEQMTCTYYNNASQEILVENILQ